MRRIGVPGTAAAALRAAGSVLLCAALTQGALAPVAAAGGPMPSRHPTAPLVTEPFVRVDLVGPDAHHEVFVRTLPSMQTRDPVISALPAGLMVGDYHATVTVTSGRTSTTSHVVLGLQSDGTASGPAGTHVGWLLYLQSPSQGPTLVSVVEGGDGSSTALLPPAAAALALIGGLLFLRRRRRPAGRHARTLTGGPRRV